jgi:hypothetical protein
MGENPGSFDGFQRGMMQSLAPVTPCKGVITENFIALD